MHNFTALLMGPKVDILQDCPHLGFSFLFITLSVFALSLLHLNKTMHVLKDANNYVKKFLIKWFLFLIINGCSFCLLLMEKNTNEHFACLHS